MGKLLNFFDKLLNLLTGRNILHNRALREITDLTRDIEEFLAEYRRAENVFGNIGQAKIDVTTITYHVGIRVKVAKHIRDKRLAPLIRQIYDTLETVKEDIYSTKLGNSYLDENLSKLNDSLQSLIDAISDIGYK